MFVMQYMPVPVERQLAAPKVPKGRLPPGRPSKAEQQKGQSAGPKQMECSPMDSGLTPKAGQPPKRQAQQQREHASASEIPGASESPGI